MTLTYEEMIKAEPRIAREKPAFTDYGLLLCRNRCGTPASASMSVAVGWIGCAPCITGEADSFDEDDLVIEEARMAA
jgi:hypothetical protein